MNKKYILMFIFLMLIWIALNESVSPLTLMIGFFVCLYSISFINRFLKTDYALEFYFHPWKFAKYSLYLLKEIYLSGFDLFMRILKNNIDQVIFDYVSDFDEELPNVLLSNAITLTPGTITVNRDRNHLTILSIETDVESVKEGIRNGLEKNIKKLVEEEEN